MLPLPPPFSQNTTPRRPPFGTSSSSLDKDFPPLTSFAWQTQPPTHPNTSFQPQETIPSFTPRSGNAASSPFSFPSSFTNSSLPSSSSSSSSSTTSTSYPSTENKETFSQNTFAEVRLISNRYVIANAFSKCSYNASLGFLLFFTRIFWSSALPSIVSKGLTLTSLVLFLLSLLNFAEGLYVKYIKPWKWEKVKSLVSNMNAQQRSLMGVDKDIAHLVDAVSPPKHPRMETKKKSLLSQKRTPKPRPHPVIPSPPPVPYRSWKPHEPTPYCYAKTADVRNATVNFVLRPPSREPMWTDEGQGGGRSPLALSARPSFQTYQVSSVPTPEEQIIAGPFQVKYLGPLETLREWKVYEDDLNVWIENLRVWLSRKLFQPLALEMKRVEQYLQLRDWAHLSFYNDVPAVDMAGTLSFPSSSSSSSSSMFGSLLPNFLASSKTPQSLSGLAACEPNEPLVKSRIQLERYLFMSTYPVTIRAYMIGRILELAEGSHLAAYRWDAGGGGASTSGSSTLLPTDAELVLHVFCTWMDSQMPGANRGLTAYSPFTVKYFRPVDEKSDLLDHLHIQMSVSRPPHFRLCQKRTIYDVFPKRNNLFSVLTLFTYNIQKDYSGYIDMLDISGNVVGLTSILSNDLSSHGYS